MSSTVRVLLWVGFMITASFSTSNLCAATSVVATNFPQEVPLLISGYAWTDVTGYSANAKALEYLQLYNKSDEVVRLSDWNISLLNAGVSTPIVISPNDVGVMAPHTHLVASFDGAVQSASLSLGNVILPDPSKNALKISIKPSDASAAYLAADYDLKATSPVWQRNYSSTGSGYVTGFTGQTTFPADIFDDGLYLPNEVAGMAVVEVYPYSSECAPFDVGVLCGDYIKLRVTDPNVDRTKLVLRTDSSSSSRTSSNTFWLGAYEPNQDGFITVTRTDANDRISLTNSGGYVWVEDLYGQATYNATMTRYESAGSDQQGWSYAVSNEGAWQWTSTPQPDMLNVFTAPVVLTAEVKSCPVGQYRNPETNRCRGIEEAVNALATCPEGQYRNPETNRCRSTAVAGSTLTPCGEGQERNPETNRCRSIASAIAELIPCDEGYERNPATNRCRKATQTASTVATPADIANDNHANSSPLLQPYAIASAVGIGAAAYGLYEWRSEIGGGYRRLRSKLSRK